jgi:hypothetical protein
MTTLTLGSMVWEVTHITRELLQFPTMPEERMQELSERGCILLDETRRRAPHDGD